MSASESLPVVRVSIMRVDPDRFEVFRDLSITTRGEIEPGLRTMKGGGLFIAGADPATASLINVSLWDTLADAQQLDRFQPMLDLGKRFTELGARFERPIMNHAGLWRLDLSPGVQTP